MNYCAGAGLYVDTARFLATNTFFKESNVTKERVASCYELVFFLRDGGAAVINGKKYPIKAGSVRFHRPGDRVYSHRFHEIYVVHFTLDREERGKVLFESVPSFLTFPESEGVHAAFKALVTAWATQDDLACMAFLWQLLACIRSQHQSQMRACGEETAFQIKKYIEEHLTEPITLRALGERFYMHPIYLQRRFKKEVGYTPAAYLQRARLAKAKTLLLTTGASIEAISMDCGFCNAAYFISIFKRSEGLTPVEYRRETRLTDI